MKQSICIIGGGTTGWWCAGYMEKFLPDAEITLIESDTIPTIGVGESTLPQVKVFFDAIGMDESVWMPGCNAIHKYGNIVINDVKSILKTKNNSVCIEFDLSIFNI